MFGDLHELGDDATHGFFAGYGAHLFARGLTRVGQQITAQRAKNFDALDAVDAEVGL